MSETMPVLPIPRSISFDLENVSRSGGVSTNGMERVVASAAGRWVCTYGELLIRSNDHILTWRAFFARLRGRAGTVLVPVQDGKRANWPVDGYGRLLAPPRVRRWQLDGTPFADPEIPAESRIIARFTAAAARRAGIVSIVVDQGRRPRVGQYFSPSPGRLHLLTEEVSAGTYRIEPTLRDAVAANQSVDFARPTCEMRLASDPVRLALDLLQFGRVTLEFVEAI